VCHPTGAKLKEFNCDCITVAFAVTPLLFLVWNENEDYRGFGSNPRPLCMGFLVNRVARGWVYL